MTRMPFALLTTPMKCSENWIDVRSNTATVLDEHAAKLSQPFAWNGQNSLNRLLGIAAKLSQTFAVAAAKCI